MEWLNTMKLVPQDFNLHEDFLFHYLLNEFKKNKNNLWCQKESVLLDAEYDL